MKIFIIYMSFQNITINNVPYVSSTAASGYLGASNNTTLINNGNWNSVGPCNMTNGKGGIADVSGNAIKILNKGIYRLNLSVDIIANEDNGKTSLTSFAFGTLNLVNQTSTSSFLGQTNPNGVYLANKGLNTTNNPGIISWLTNAYSSGNSEPSTYDSNGASNPPWFGYQMKVNSGNDSYPGICTTELVFTNSIDNLSLYFNINTNKNNITIGHCYFVLQMISSEYLI